MGSGYGVGTRTGFARRVPASSSTEALSPVPPQSIARVIVTRHSLAARRRTARPTRANPLLVHLFEPRASLDAMSLAVQASLLDLADEARLGPLTRHGRPARRSPSGAWVDHRPGWVRGVRRGARRARCTASPWRAERRRMYDRVVDVPRLVAWYDAPDALPHPVLADARSALSAYYRPELGEPFATAGCCLYRDGRDSVAWHGDTIGRGAREDTLVAIVSFGSPRSLLLRPRTGGSEPAVPARARRPARHGRLVPAHLGARGAEDEPAPSARA